VKAAPDPVRQFEHSHASLTRLAQEIRELVRAQPATGRTTLAARKKLLGRLERLRDELLHHFANEEEGLFPFVSHHLPARVDRIGRLEVAHDTICGAIVRLVQLVEFEPRALDAGRASVVALYERFEKAYAAHSQEEAALFEDLSRALDAGQRAELAAILHGL
jgi:iron-sulfur cluster repair protein YtfE (RIC family)